MFIPEETLEFFKTHATEQNILLDDRQLADFDNYASFLVEYNQKVNLTAITDPEGIVIKHFLDSLLLSQAVEISQGASIIDVGTGAGFPAVPMKILRPDLQVTLMDSLNKRIVFLQELSRRLGQKNTLLHARAEEGGRQSQLRESFDLATARAVADLRILAEYCIPFLKIGGIFAALKGWDCDAEMEHSTRAIEKLGGKLEDVKRFELPGGNRRAILVIRKISQTPPLYPRTAAKMAKNPL